MTALDLYEAGLEADTDPAETDGAAAVERSQSRLKKVLEAL